MLDYWRVHLFFLGGVKNPLKAKIHAARGLSAYWIRLCRGWCSGFEGFPAYPISLRIRGMFEVWKHGNWTLPSVCLLEMDLPSVCKICAFSDGCQAH